MVKLKHWYFLLVSRDFYHEPILAVMMPDRNRSSVAVITIVRVEFSEPVLNFSKGTVVSQQVWHQFPSISILFGSLVIIWLIVAKGLKLPENDLLTIRKNLRKY